MPRAPRPAARARRRCCFPTHAAHSCRRPGDFQFLKSGSDEPCIQPIESSQLVCFAARVAHPVAPDACAVHDPASNAG
ncbi:hypothetical protein L564_3028 [Bordetella pertussis CHLA-15]|nr:hypothetical protein L564_3028 [Bordetella pertussis CHLA-15]